MSLQISICMFVIRAMYTVEQKRENSLFFMKVFQVACLFLLFLYLNSNPESLVPLYLCPRFDVSLLVEALGGDQQKTMFTKIDRN